MLYEGGGTCNYLGKLFPDIYRVLCNSHLSTFKRAIDYKKKKHTIHILMLPYGLNHWAVMKMALDLSLEIIQVNKFESFSNKFYLHTSAQKSVIIIIFIIDIEKIHQPL